ncbi:probable Lys-63-specific deubiquitinase BRCC36 at N-terminal half [Coccomyxa sp. Obi]|nr:probable Lys-63-specific deubiquitinase BRCC36 at N-terminal half [Coccomyxa sp. Obi]
MALTRVELTPDVFIACATHALTTESEEVMGLLLGDVHYGTSGEAVAHISVAMPQIRTDRRKDRVEASPEQLASAMAVAEKLSEGSQTKVRVIGWYHSHPHITVLPSHVDVRTQGSYQMLDEGFIGIILSTFNQGAVDCTQQIQVTAFQSVQQAQPTLSPTNSYEVDSPMAKALAASAADARQRVAAGGQWTRREVPLTIGAELAHADQKPGGLRFLLEVLFEEERQAFIDAVSAAADENGRVDPLTAMHNAGVYQQHMCRLMEVVAGPVLASLRVRCAEASLQLDQLQAMKEAILATQRDGSSKGGKGDVNIQISYMDMPHGWEPAAASVSRPEDRSASQPDQARVPPSWPPPGLAPEAAASAPADVSSAWTASGPGSTDELAWPAASSSSWGQEARAEQQRAASAWSSGHDPYDAGQVTISQGAPAASENAGAYGAVRGAAIAPDFSQGAAAWSAATMNGHHESVPSATPNQPHSSQPKHIPAQSADRYTSPLVSHPLPDQARSQSPTASKSAGASPVKIRITERRHEHASGSTDSSETAAAPGESGAADRGKHKKNLWHRSTDPFAGLLTETIPGKLSLRGSRKKSPDPGSRGK